MKALPRLHRQWIRLLDRLRPSETHSMLLWAAVVGFIGALATSGFR
jgi:CIC family chloride channel protein